MIKFIQIIIQEKDHNDYRSFCICEKDNLKYELRGYGTLPEFAAKEAFEHFQDIENWDVYGYVID
jgi:hypothetical protein